MGNILTELHRHCAETPDQLLYEFINVDGTVRESWTYRDFLSRVESLAGQLRQCGAIEPERPVLLAYPQCVEMLAAFFACVQAGAIPVPVPSPESGATLPTALARLRLIRNDSRAVSALTLSSVREMIVRHVTDCGGSSDPVPELSWIATDGLTATAPPAAFCSGSGSSPLFLQYTSGSTQQPRGVIVTHDNVLANCRATTRVPMVFVSWLPQFHDMGLIAACLFPAIIGGTSILFSSVDFLRNPSLWLEALTRYRATTTVAPNFAFEYCLREDKIPDADLSRFDLTSLREFFSGAEPVRSATFFAFRRRFARCGLSVEAVGAAYGLAEFTLIATMHGQVALKLDRRHLERQRVQIDRSDGDSVHSFSVMSTGRPVSGTDIRIVCPETCRDLGEQSIGEIWISGPSRAVGYWNNPEATQAVFRAHLSDEPRGVEYLRTGDLGFLNDGELFVCGRVKDLLIVRGCNYYPQDIEAAVERACSALRPGSVICFGSSRTDGTEIAVVLIEGRSLRQVPELSQLHRLILRECRIPAGVIAVVAPRSIARTTSGKLARSETRRRWESGDISVVAEFRPANEDGSSGDLLEYLFAGGPLEDSEDLTLAELGVDSLSLVSLNLEIRRRLMALGFPDVEELSDLTGLQAFTLRELRDLIEKTQQRGSRWHPDQAAIARRYRDVETQDSVRMQADSRLDADITATLRIHAAQSEMLPAADSQREPMAGTVLLTGATGFVGSFLLDALLRQTSHRVLAVVRAQDERHARSRISAALERAAQPLPISRAAVDARVDVICGNLAEPRIGLNSSDWDRCVRDVTSIYHCGSLVDYVKPYSALRNANAGSTRELLRLSAQGQLKPFRLVSSTFIFGWSGNVVLRESDSNASMQGLNFGYSQSKWVAEQLVGEAAANGLPVVVFRPSLITASLNGCYSRSDIMARTLAYMIRHGICANCPNQLSFLPVEVVAANLVAIAEGNPSGGFAVHMTADEYYALSDVARVMTEEFGYRFDMLSLSEFVDHLNQFCGPEELLYPLVPFFNRNYRRIERMQDKRYDNQTYRMARAAAGCLPEPPLSQTVSAMVRFLLREGLIPEPSHILLHRS